MDIQDIVVFMAVLLAAAWLTRRIYRVFTSSSRNDPIGTCDHCPKNRDTGSNAQIVEINSSPSKD